MGTLATSAYVNSIGLDRVTASYVIAAHFKLQRPQRFQRARPLSTSSTTFNVLNRFQRPQCPLVPREAISRLTSTRRDCFRFRRLFYELNRKTDKVRVIVFGVIPIGR